MIIHGYQPARYHAIRSFSSSKAKTVIADSPLHAITDDDSTSTDDQDMGTVVHYLLTGVGTAPVIVQADDWRTNKAKEARADARRWGRIAMLPKAWDRANDTADAARAALKRHSIATGLVPPAFTGRSECVMTWAEATPWGGVHCKAMLDHVWISDHVIIDLKFTGAGLGNAAIERHAEDFGHAIQDTAYRRAYESNVPDSAGRTRFYFLMVENRKPHDSRLVECDGAMREVGLRRWTKALHRWAECVSRNDWPGRSPELHRMTTPPWAVSRLEEE